MKHAEIVEQITHLVESLGVLIILLAVVISILKYLQDTFKSNQHAYEYLRLRLGRGILLGLEFLVAGDIISTVTLNLEMKSVLTLGMLVLIRSFLTFSIEAELKKLMGETEEEPIKTK